MVALLVGREISLGFGVGGTELDGEFLGLFVRFGFYGDRGACKAVFRGLWWGFT